MEKKSSCITPEQARKVLEDRRKLRAWKRRQRKLREDSEYVERSIAELVMEGVLKPSADCINKLPV
jgi:hypothetical protein